MIAWLAPGQGMERPKMGRDVARAHPSAAALLEGLDAGLHGTARVQPALVAVSLGAARVLMEAGVRCDVVCGHSLGELAAWSIAGGATAREAITLARARGQAMADAAARAPGGMWALPGSARAWPDHLQVAVDNPGQVVLSGRLPGPIGATPIPTEGAWHSPLMQPAVPALQRALHAIPVRALRTPVVRNVNGEISQEDSVLRADLEGQLTRPVRWTAVLRRLASLGVRDAVLLGPGRHLARHLAEVLPEVRVHRTDRASDVRATVQALAS